MLGNLGISWLWVQMSELVNGPLCMHFVDRFYTSHWKMSWSLMKYRSWRIRMWVCMWNWGFSWTWEFSFIWVILNIVVDRFYTFHGFNSWVWFSILCTVDGLGKPRRKYIYIYIYIWRYSWEMSTCLCVYICSCGYLCVGGWESMNKFKQSWEMSI